MHEPQDISARVDELAEVTNWCMENGFNGTAIALQETLIMLCPSRRAPQLHRDGETHA